MSTTATIKAKGCQSTGITEDLAKRCHDQLGRKVLAVVELQASSRTENRDGDEKVQLEILTIEPAPDSMTEEHLRNLARSFHFERQLANADQPLYGDDGIEPDLKTVLAAGRRHEPHPFLPVDAADDNGICDVCGEVADRSQHQSYDKVPDPFTVPEEVLDEDDTEEDEDLDEEEGDVDEEDEDQDDVDTDATVLTFP